MEFARNIERDLTREFTKEFTRDATLEFTLVFTVEFAGWISSEFPREITGQFATQLRKETTELPRTYSSPTATPIPLHLPP